MVLKTFIPPLLMSLPNPAMSVKNLRERNQSKDKDTNSGIIAVQFYLSCFLNPRTEKTINIMGEKGTNSQGNVLKRD